MKTGFICASGFNVVATATRGGRKLIVVVFGSRSGAVRSEKAAQLFEKGFTAGGLSWLMPSLGSVDALQPIAAAPPNLREEMCGKHRKRPAAEEADDEGGQAAEQRHRPELGLCGERCRTCAARAATRPAARPATRSSAADPGLGRHAPGRRQATQVADRDAARRGSGTAATRPPRAETGREARERGSRSLRQAGNRERVGRRLQPDAHRRARPRPGRSRRLPPRRRRPARGAKNADTPAKKKAAAKPKKPAKRSPTPKRRRAGRRRQARRRRPSRPTNPPSNERAGAHRGRASRARRSRSPCSPASSAPARPRCSIACCKDPALAERRRHHQRVRRDRARPPAGRAYRGRRDAALDRLPVLHHARRPGRHAGEAAARPRQRPHDVQPRDHRDDRPRRSRAGAAHRDGASLSA